MSLGSPDRALAPLAWWWPSPREADEVLATSRNLVRRRDNSVRRLNALLRQREVFRLLDQYGMKWGAQARIARKLGVSQATISRDIKTMLAGDLIPCPIHSPAAAARALAALSG